MNDGEDTLVLGASDAEQRDGSQAVVIPTPIDLSAKHILQSSWTLWFDPSRKKRDHLTWGDHLKRIFTFDSVEDFWRLFNNIKLVQNLPLGSSYHLFKRGIEPKWEDSANQKGGKWLINFQTTSRHVLLPRCWLFIVLAVIGSQFDDMEQITGVVVCVRNTHDRIALWTTDATEKEKCLRIGTQIKSLLGISFKIGYQPHSDAIKQVKLIQGEKPKSKNKERTATPQ